VQYDEAGQSGLHTTTGGSMGQFKSDRERVEFALKTEHDGHDFYQMAARKTSNKLARAAFTLLAKEELRHVALIEGLSGQLGGKGAKVDVEEVTLRALESNLKTIYGTATEEPVEGKMDPAEAYDKAIELEKLITSTYSAYAKECEDDGARRLFAVLYNEEEHHLSLLKDMYSYLTRPEEWFIDRDGVMLDGG
jgi:rubrerythrin